MDRHDEDYYYIELSSMMDRSNMTTDTKVFMLEKMTELGLYHTQRDAVDRVLRIWKRKQELSVEDIILRDS